MARQKKSQDPKIDDLKRIAIYGRVSTKRQAEEGDSLESQERNCLRFVEEKKAIHGWNVDYVRSYFDRGKSGKNTDRPELKRLRQDIANGEINLVVTFKLDRITRSVRDFVELWDCFNANSVDVVSIRESFDTSSAMGKAMLQIVMVFAELERHMNSERTKSTLRTRTENGLWGGGFAFGYVKNPSTEKLVPHPVDAKVVRIDFFDAFEAEGSVGAVKRRLDRLGILRPIRRTVRRDPLVSDTDQELLAKSVEAPPIRFKPFENNRLAGFSKTFFTGARSNAVM